MKKIQLLVCAHKYDVNTRNGGIYTAIQVGKDLNLDLDLGYVNDNTGDNISDKNPNYCELTALFWGWKNIRDVEYFGLCHYRRYFNIDIRPDNIDKIINGYEMLVIDNGKCLSRHERANNLMLQTSQEDYYLFADTFLSMYPQYKDAFWTYFYDSKDSYPFQMFIAKKSLYDDYCSFMFPVLFELEKKLKAHGYTRQKRTMGYIGEWFLGLYIYCKKIKVKQVPLMMCQDNKVNQSKTQIVKSVIRRIAYRLVDIVHRPSKKIVIPDPVMVGFKNDRIQLNYFH